MTRIEPPFCGFRYMAYIQNNVALKRYRPHFNTGNVFENKRVVDCDLILSFIALM